MNKQNILIADDDKPIRRMLKEILEEKDYEISEAKDGYETIEKIEKYNFDLVLLDLKMPGIDGIEVLKKTANKNKSPIFIVVTAHGTIKKAIESTQLGAYDFIEKPIEEERILLIIENALKTKSLELENISLKKELYSELEIIGSSEAAKQIHIFIKKASAFDENVLITGSNGTGKDLLARNIHSNSKRKNNPFVIIDCAAISENLIESELFGYEKGAFTGATKTQIGKFEYASGGTIFLNEIGELSPTTQAKLLHVIENKNFQRVGGVKEIETDVRIISATNKNLSKAIEQNKFRKDLFYRLNILNFHIADLSKRREDIIPLFEFFMDRFCEKNGLTSKRLEPAAISVLYNYGWQGNVRQLKNLTNNLAITSAGETITINEVELLLKKPTDKFTKDKKGLSAIGVEESYSLSQAREDFEKEYITNQLKTHHWNVRKTAETLQVERTHLYKLIKKLEIEKPE